MIFFFFSSRRRHTRYIGDWSSDVCSSDLDVAVVCWLLGSARGTAEEVTALHGEVLEHLMLRLVDTPVRGFVYETAGPAPADVLARGEAIVDRASTTWRIPAATIRAAPADHAAWLEDATRSATGVLRPSD